MPTSQPPRTVAPVAPLWPIVGAGACGVVVLAVLTAFQALTPGAALAGTVVLVASTALLAFASDRSAEARQAAVTQAAEQSTGQGPPYASLINALPDPILVVSAVERDDLTSHRYIFANSAARQLLRIDRNQGLVVSVTRDPGVLKVVEEALFDGRDAETLYETGGAQDRTLKAYARPLGLGLDGRRFALLVFRDETEIRRLERTRSDFLANASHELRTPLASLSGFIETLRGHAREDAGARDRFLAIMQAQAERMARLIDDLLSLSRIELNEHIAPADKVDLALCVSDVLDALAPIAAEREVRIETRLAPGGAARLAADRDQIVQVVQNLVDNALKYSSPGTAVRVEVDAGLDAETAAAGLGSGAPRHPLLTPDHGMESYAVLRVSDQGPGLAREHLPRLTERFYRVEGQKSGERSGTGLGLAIVKHIINRHRGGMVVESELGEGATFTVYLPLLTMAAEQRPRPHVAKVS